MEPVLARDHRAAGYRAQSGGKRQRRDAKAKNELPKALMIVHLYGQHADIDPIFALCNEYGVGRAAWSWSDVMDRGDLVPDEVALRDPATWRYVGTSMPRLERR